MQSTNSLAAITRTMLKRVSTTNGLPFHRQAEDMLRQLAAHPHFENGALLPDEVTLAAQIGVSRGTARAALTRLAQQGIVERKAGIGTRVTRPPVESGAGAWRSFTREMARKGINVETYRADLHMHTAPKAVTMALQIKPGSTVARLDRLRGWDGVPVLRSRSWFHPRLRLSPEDDYTRPLYELIEAATGTIADRAREELTAVLAEIKLAAVLNVNAGEPLLCRRHLVFDTNARPMEYAEIHYVSARFTLTMDLQKENA